jgi:hypothetical protein
MGIPRQRAHARRSPDMSASKPLQALVVAGVIFAANVHGQSQAPAAGSGDGARPGAQRAEALGAEQVAKVKAVLAPYRPGSLNVDDAKAIKRALRDAGMRPSPALDQALRAEGFSAERLDQLDPRPPGPPGGGERRPDGGSPPARASPTAPPSR